MGKRKIFENGETFGRLTVIKRVENHITPNGSAKAMYLCKCLCGNSKIVGAQDLKNGKTTSCGCYNSEATRNRFKTHGMRKTKAYSTWAGIKTRCFNKKSSRYKDYGGRGITMCEKWAEDFIAFYEYASKLPHAFEEGYSIDRINNDGNYEPNNIKFSTPHEQNLNRRRITHGIKNEFV